MNLIWYVWSIQAHKFSHKLFFRILNDNKSTVFGLEHDFASIKDMDEYREKIPLAESKDVQPYVNRMQAGESNVLFSTDVAKYFLTSGTSSGVPSIIPCSNMDLKLRAFLFGPLMMSNLLKKLGPTTVYYRGMSCLMSSSGEVTSEFNTESSLKAGIKGFASGTVKSMVQIYDKDDSRFEEDWPAEDLAFLDQLKRQEVAENITEQLENTTKHESGKNSTTVSSNSTSTVKKKKKVESRHLQNISDDSPPPKLEPFNPDNSNSTSLSTATETFVMISSSPTPEGPRNSVRLEGRRRFNRGLFIIDLRHMPAGCGTWPAFWLTDEANWPVNGEIDIVEGVNYQQDTAKTALHTTKVCQMDDVPEGSKTGSWDTSVGIPNAKTGIPDMTFRWAQNCFVYDPHQ